MANQKISELPKRCKDITGQRFGRLVVLGATSQRKHGCVIWRCICDCGNECLKSGSGLRQGGTKSCGCLQKELAAKLHTIHGYRKHSLYSIWITMIQRCENPNYKGYKNYGGRGISVCESWHKIENFLVDMGERPSGLTLERKDNEKGYSPENCKWATWKEQNNNQRDREGQHWFFAFNLKTGEWDEDNNQHEFAKRYKLSQSNISSCLHDEQKAHKNWKFKWVDS